jgi:hypothetical protein
VEAWAEVTSLDRKLAIPPAPAEGESLNLLAEMWSRVRGGVLDRKRQKEKVRRIHSKTDSHGKSTPLKIKISGWL